MQQGRQEYPLGFKHSQSHFLTHGRSEKQPLIPIYRVIRLRLLNVSGLPSPSSYNKNNIYVISQLFKCCGQQLKKALDKHQVFYNMCTYMLPKSISSPERSDFSSGWHQLHSLPEQMTRLYYSHVVQVPPLMFGCWAANELCASK